MIFNFKFDRGNVWLFIQPENQADVNRLADLFLYLDEEGDYHGEAIGIDVTRLLAYTNARHNYKIDADYSKVTPEPSGSHQPPSAGQEGQEGKPKPSEPPAQE